MPTEPLDDPLPKTDVGWEGSEKKDFCNTSMDGPAGMLPVYDIDCVQLGDSKPLKSGASTSDAFAVGQTTVFASSELADCFLDASSCANVTLAGVFLSIAFEDGCLDIVGSVLDAVLGVFGKIGNWLLFG